MGWVVLTLRKKELTRTHSEYELRDLQISREERQLQRKKAYDTMCLQDDATSEARDLKSTYDSKKSSLRSKMQAIRKNNSNYSTNADYLQYQEELEDAKENYEADVNDAKSQSEDEISIVEQEASDQETYLEEEKVTVEAQMEAVSEEISSIKDQISTEIQNETISLK